MKNTILIIEDEPSMRLGMSHFLSSSGYSVKTCEDGAEGISAIEKETYDVVITDLKLPHYDGLTILSRTRSVAPHTGVIIVTAYADVKTAVQAIKDGAFDYIAKPFSNEELLITITRFLEFRKLERELHRLRSSLSEKSGFENLIGVSSSMRAVFDRIESVAGTDVPILIQGESGTGKELVANAIHNLSRRKDGPYIKINCAAIPESLFESELFGHQRGTFTGATETRKGKFEIANGGSIFFDEIGEMPLGLQAKLLRVIEEHAVTRLGGGEPITIDTRGIYATGKNLREVIRTGGFREDLFYRINVVPIVIPPLRERKEDIPHLVEHFIRHFGESFSKPDLRISPSAYEALLLYSYPGNVRELKHAIERAVLLSKNGLIDISDLPEEYSDIAKTERERATPQDATLPSSVMALEKQMIIGALKEARGKKIDASRKLGISRKVLWKKIKEHKIEDFE
jgi:DNA-binding NtrC family response regulator